MHATLADSSFIERIPCPACGSSDANAVYSDGHTHCFSCNKHVQGNENQRNSRSTAFMETEQDCFDTIDESDVDLNDTASQVYADIRKRGLSEKTCRKFGYYIRNGTQNAPYYSKGRLIATHVRRPNKEFSWTGSPSGAELFGQHLWPNTGKRLVITEGEIDALSIAQVMPTWPVVSLPNGAQNAVKAIKQNIEFVEGYTTVVLAFDNDEPGREAVTKVAALLSPGKAATLSYPEGCKDANDCLRANVDIVKLIWNAHTYRPDGIIDGVEMWDVIRDHYHGLDMVQSYTTPYPEFQRITQGYRKGELWMWTAGTGIGKSTVVHEAVGYHLLANNPDLKIGIVALEESTKRTSLRYISLDMGKPLHIPDELRSVTEEQLHEAHNRTVGSGRFFLYNHFGSLDGDNLASKIRYLAVGCGCDFVIFDHISIAVSGIREDDERRIIDNLMTDLRSLVEQTGVGLHVISHLKKKSNSGQGTSHEEGGRVCLDDLRGSGSLKQLSDVVIALERNQQAEGVSKNDTRLRILKNRYTGETGEADLIRFDASTNRLHFVDERLMDQQTGEEF